MNGSQWGLPGAGRVATPGGSWWRPEESTELCGILLRHPRGPEAGALRSGAKQRLITVRGGVADQSGKGKINAMSGGDEQPLKTLTALPPIPRHWQQQRRVPCRSQESLSPSLKPIARPQPSVAPLSPVSTDFTLRNIHCPCILTQFPGMCPRPGQFAYSILLATWIGSGMAR